jgi:imidazolonepropionase-like amidohydrolase
MTIHDRGTLIKADRIIGFEGDSGKYRFLLMRQGLIDNVFSEEPSLSNITFLDCTGSVIAPCFCDYHLHFPARSIASADTVIDMLLSYGIVRAYEGGDRQDAGLEMKQIAAGRLDIAAAGHALYKEGGYGRYIGKGVRDAVHARGVIDELIAGGADYLKVVHSGIYEPESDRITEGGFEPDELRQIIAYAGERGMNVFVHANGDKAVRGAVRAGAFAVVHGLNVSDDALSEMAEKKIVLIPTLCAFQRLQDLHETEGAKRNISRTLDRHMAAVNRAYERGVKVLPGSDAGPEFIPYGESFLAELGLFFKSGILYEDVVGSASARPISKSHSADFLVLESLTIKEVVLGGMFRQ